MQRWLAISRRFCLFTDSTRLTFRAVLTLTGLLLMGGSAALAQPSEAGGEASLQLPDLRSVNFLGIDGHRLLLIGLLFCLFGLAFGLAIYMQLKNAPVHRSMREISELIYETCKTYLVTQGKFILVLWVFIAVVITAYFGWLAPVPGKPIAVTLPIILLFSLIGIAGSYGVAWFGIRVNTFANSRTAFASLRGKPYPIYAIPLKATPRWRRCARRATCGGPAGGSPATAKRRRRPSSPTRCTIPCAGTPKTRSRILPWCGARSSTSITNGSSKRARSCRPTKTRHPTADPRDVFK
jgi:hypothetical protein